MKVRIDPVSRHFHVTHKVPSGAWDRVVIRCAWSHRGATLLVRARDGDGWLEQTFNIRGAGQA